MKQHTQDILAISKSVSILCRNVGDALILYSLRVINEKLNRGANAPTLDERINNRVLKNGN